MNTADAADAAAEHDDWLLGLSYLLVQHFDDLDAFALACLDTGRRMLGLSTGIVSHLTGDDYEVVQVLSPLEDLHAGDHVRLSDTYCSAVADSGQTTAYHAVGSMEELRWHPLYVNLQLEAYIGAPIMVGGALYGTLNFSDAEARPCPFSAREMQVMDSMAALLGRFIEREQADRALRERERMFEQSFRHAIIGKGIVRPSGEIIDVNPALCRILGYRSEQMIGLTLRDFVHPEELSRLDALYEDLFTDRRDHFQIETRYLNVRAEIIEAQMGVALVRDMAGAPLYTVLQLFDVTDRNRVQRELLAANDTLRRLSITDSLTGLHNRRALQQSLQLEVSRSRRNGRPLALIAIDLDYFKIINDRHGHGVGDQVLRQFALILRDSVREADVVARPGGEEFAILLPDTPVAQACALAERLRRTVREAAWPVERVTASFGIAGMDAPAMDIPGLLKAADEALYAAKHAGRDRVVVAGKLTSAS